MIELVNMAFTGLAYLQVGFLALVVIGAVWGAIQVLMTRDDAFTVIDRSKQNWLLLLGGTAVGVMVLGPFLGFIWIIGAVIVGIYWQDIRPSIRDVLGNAQ